MPRILPALQHAVGSVPPPDAHWCPRLHGSPPHPIRPPLSRCAIAAAGTAPAAAASSGDRAPGKRGGRPRERKSYDDQIDPGLPIDEVRRLRRMLSNRESARRSRRRRQTQLSTLEEELEQLKSGGHPPPPPRPRPGVPCGSAAAARRLDSVSAWSAGPGHPRAMRG